MATFRVFAYNTGAAVTGTFNVGTLAVGAATNIQYFGNYGGVKWFAGPDEDPGYVIAASVSAGNIPTPDGLNDGTVQFWRTKTKTDQSFIDLSNFIARKNGAAGNFTSTADATAWLTSNNFWYSYATPVTQNLVLYYDPSDIASYLGTGTKILDLSGNGLTGNMSNISFTSPYFSYNGSNSQVTVNDNALLEPGSGNWTMEVWVNQNTAGNDVVLGKFDPGGLSADVSYSVRTTSTTYYAQLGSGTGSGGTLFANSSNYVGSLNTWYQIVYVFKNGATKTIETFVNGASIGSVNHSLPSLLNTPSNLYLGSYNNGEYSQWFDGKIGIVRLYSSALTSANVSQNFDADRSKYGI